LSAYGPTTLADWQTAGGYDSNTMLYGDWSHSQYSNSWHWMMSNYDYRDVPLSVERPYHWQEDGTPDMGIPGIMPHVYGRIGQPIFRTVKELGGRALLSDAFEKGYKYDANGVFVNCASYNSSIQSTALAAGFGVQGHRKVYNVMYGDGHVVAFGDPQENIAWAMHGNVSSVSTPTWTAALGGVLTVGNSYRTNGADNPFASYALNAAGKDIFKIDGTIDGTNSVKAGCQFWYTDWMTWHNFDLANGIDANVSD
jgi:hypothetical protein